MWAACPVLQGIKITNKDTKGQVLELLKAEQAAKMMDMEMDPAAIAAAAAEKKQKKKKKKLRLAKDAKLKGSSRKAAAAASDAAAPMEG